MHEGVSPSAMCKHVLGARMKSLAEAIRPIRSRAAAGCVRCNIIFRNAVGFVKQQMSLIVETANESQIDGQDWHEFARIERLAEWAQDG